MIRASSSTVLKGVLTVIGLGCIIYGYTVEIPYFTNTFDVRYLFFRAAFVGGLVGWILNKVFNKNIENDAIDTFRDALTYTVLMVILMPLLAIFTNHALSKKADDTTEKVIFLKELPLKTSRFGMNKASVMSIDAYYTYFIKNDKEQRIRSKHQLFKGIESETEVKLPIKKGFWGFDFVTVD